MNLEIQAKKYGVCDLKYAQELKELGVKQESLWWWIDINDTRIWKDTNKPYIASSRKSCYSTKKEENDYIQNNYFYSAFTVAELGEILPKWIYTIRLDYEPYDKCWCVVGKNGMIEITANTEANARAKMIIWLIKKGYIKV